MKKLAILLVILAVFTGASFAADIYFNNKPIPPDAIMQEGADLWIVKDVLPSDIRKDIPDGCTRSDKSGYLWVNIGKCADIFGWRTRYNPDTDMMDIYTYGERYITSDTGTEAADKAYEKYEQSLDKKLDIEEQKELEKFKTKEEEARLEKERDAWYGSCYAPYYQYNYQYPYYNQYLPPFYGYSGLKKERYIIPYVGTNINLDKSALTPRIKPAPSFSPYGSCYRYRTENIQQFNIIKNSTIINSKIQFQNKVKINEGGK